MGGVKRKRIRREKNKLQRWEKGNRGGGAGDKQDELRYLREFSVLRFCLLDERPIKYRLLKLGQC